MRKNIKWHDGVPFTTQDIKFTHDFAQRPDVLWESPNSLTLNIIDEHTFSITFHDDKSYGPFDRDGRFPKHLLELLL